MHWIAIALLTAVFAYPSLYVDKCIISVNEKGGLSAAKFNLPTAPLEVKSGKDILILSEDIPLHGTLKITTNVDLSKLPGLIFSNLTFTLNVDDQVKTLKFFYNPKYTEMMEYTAPNFQKDIQMFGASHEDLGFDRFIDFQSNYAKQHREFSAIIGDGDIRVIATVSRDEYKPNVIILDIQQGTPSNKDMFTNKSGVCSA